MTVNTERPWYHSALFACFAADQPADREDSRLVNGKTTVSA
jgi:hypothetical protein